jgi:hypothetical protein
VGGLSFFIDVHRFFPGGLQDQFQRFVLSKGVVWGFPSIIEISVRKFEIRLNSEVLVNSV